MSLAHERGSPEQEGSACAALSELYVDLGAMIAAEDLAYRAMKIGDDNSRARAHRCLVRIERRRHDSIGPSTTQTVLCITPCKLGTKLSGVVFSRKKLQSWLYVIRQRKQCRSA